jgi:hypothetical protein
MAAVARYLADTSALVAQVTGQPVQWVVPRGTVSLTTQSGKLSPINELPAARRVRPVRVS